jgi:DNA polymerase V
VSVYSGSFKEFPTCLLKEEAEPRKAIQVSRTFGTPLHTQEEVKEVISTFATTLGAKLRRQRLCATGLSLFIASSRFQEPRLYKDTSLTLESPSQDTITLIQSLLRALEGIFEPRIAYKKAGIMASGLVPEGVKQGMLFWSDSLPHHANRQELNQAMDGLNKRFGAHTVKSARCGLHPTWMPKATLRSPTYTTRWQELPEVSSKLCLRG